MIELNLEQKRQVRAYVLHPSRYETKRIAIGRSVQYAGPTWSTPVAVVEGNQPPKLAGKPYLKTHFKNGRFSKTLYTPSTLRIEVGIGWLRSQGIVKDNNNSEN